MAAPASRRPPAPLRTPGLRASRRLIAARGLRGFADGAVSVVLSTYLLGLGFSALEVGALATATLGGSALLTLGVGLAGGRFAPRGGLLAARALGAAPGLGFASVAAAVPLFLISFFGAFDAQLAGVLALLYK